MPPLFGKLFDMNHDGHASQQEEMFGMMMFDELAKEEKRRKQEKDLFDLELLDELDEDDDNLSDDDWDI